MATYTCAICHRVYQQIRDEEVCINCNANDEAQFQRIKAYLWEHPGTNAQELCLLLNVNMSQIKRYLRSERLEVVQAQTDFLLCEHCNTPIRSGHLCEACAREEMARGLSKQNEAQKNAERAQQRDDAPHRGLELRDFSKKKRER